MMDKVMKNYGQLEYVPILDKMVNFWNNFKIMVAFTRN